MGASKGCGREPPLAVCSTGGVKGWGRLEEAAARPRGHVVSTAAARVAMAGRSFSASSPVRGHGGRSCCAAMVGGARAQLWLAEAPAPRAPLAPPGMGKQQQLVEPHDDLTRRSIFSRWPEPEAGAPSSPSAEPTLRRLELRPWGCCYCCSRRRSSGPPAPPAVACAMAAWELRPPWQRGSSRRRSSGPPWWRVLLAGCRRAARRGCGRVGMERERRRGGRRR